VQGGRIIVRKTECERTILVESSHENLGTKFDIFGVFKSDASLAKVEDVGKLVKGLMKQNYFVVVGGQLTAWIEITVTQ
jgi:hypothetical protein